MMTITLEGLLTSIVKQAPLKQEDLNYINAIIENIKQEKFITTKESNDLILIVKQYRKTIAPYLRSQLDQYVKNTKFSTTEPIDKNKILIKIENDIKLKKAITISSEFNLNLSRFIKSNNSLIRQLSWDISSKKWKMALHEKNIEFISTLCSEFSTKTILDSELQNYIEEINSIKQNENLYFPTLIKEDDTFKFKNIKNNFTTSNIYDALYEAKKRSITKIDTSITSLAEYNEIKKTDLEFLTNKKTITMDNIEDLSNLSNYIFPAIVVLPDEIELESLKHCLAFFNSIGIKNEEISVLFRLSNAYCKNFNVFVKDNNINYICSKNSKVIFIKKVIPKLIFQKGIEHTTLIHFSNTYSNFPFRTRIFIKNTFNEIKINNATKL